METNVSELFTGEFEAHFSHRINVLYIYTPYVGMH